MHTNRNKKKKKEKGKAQRPIKKLFCGGAFYIVRVYIKDGV